MGKISNVFTMLELLSNNKKYSIQELSDRLEVSKRMIRLYKDELEKSGIYTDTIRGPYGGYVLNQNARLPNRGFSKYDVALLESTYKLLNDNKDFKLHKEYNNLIDKVKGIYHGSKKKSDQINLPDKDEKDKYNVLSKAVKHHRKVWINFLSINGSSKERIIHPCDMFFYDGEWFISAFCELRSEIRHFNLSRIIDYRLLDDKY